ncbi:MAG: class I SAM-dependent methyltransferase [Chloroflexota bacterium]
MTQITFTEFRKYVRRRDVFGYNRKLVETSLTGLNRMFDGSVVLDVGAGTRLKHFKSYTDKVRYLVGVDMAHEDLLLNHDVDSSVVGNAQQLPFRSGTFDHIVCVDVVEHLTDPAAFLKETARCLRPGGTMIICTPNLLGYKNIISSLMPRPALDLAWRVLKGRPGQPHRTYYRSNTIGRLRKLAGNADFKIEQAHYLDEISHFYYSRPALCMLAYLYGRMLQGLHMRFFLNYMVCVLRKNSAAGETDYTRLHEAAAAAVESVDKSKERLVKV